MTVPAGTMSGMEITDHIAAIRREGDLLAVAAEQAGLDAVVPSCSPWRVRDLLRHLGYVHRWAAGYVTERREERLPGRPTESELLSGGPPDADLLSWFRAGHASLVTALTEADPALACWTFLEAPSPLAFWARRQAHETAIHRADAGQAAGQQAQYGAEFAADGIDELIMGFFGRDAAELTDLQRASGRQSLLVNAADTGDAWLMELTGDGKLATSVRRGTGAADCALAGPAQGLYLLLWNRVDPAGGEVEVTGDSAVLRAWQDEMRVTWE
jgi:uncharacterized protein (TIGR03083 family)